MDALIQPSHTFLHWFDMQRIFTKLNSQIKSVPQIAPGTYMDHFEAEFEKHWQEKENGIKNRRDPVILDDEKLLEESKRSWRDRK